MSETIEVRINEIFDSFSGSSKLTKTYMVLNSGKYPVYSAKTIGETTVGYINTFMFDNEGLQLTTNGANAGTWIYREKHKFSLNGDARLYIVKNEYLNMLDLKYLFFLLKQSFETECFSWTKKATKANTENLKIKIPINSNGKFDLEKQKELAQKYKDVEEKKRILLSKIEFLSKNKIVFSKKDNTCFVNINLNEAVVHHNGKAAYTKEWCQEHAGDIPLYSANNSRPIATMDKADYDGEFLTYSKNGCAGYITVLNGKFSVNGDRCVITLNKEYKNIDLLYLKYYLEPIFRANIKGRMGINGKNEYTKLNSTMIKNLNIQIPVPIKENGEYDLEKQQELAQKYATIESIKQNLYTQVEKLISITAN